MGTRAATKQSDRSCQDSQLPSPEKGKKCERGGATSDPKSSGRFLKRQLRLLPRKVARQDWQILFLAREMRMAKTEVQRGVIREWLERSEGRKRRYLEKMERCRLAYRRVTGKEPPTHPALPKREPSLRVVEDELVALDPAGDVELEDEEELEMEASLDMLSPKGLGRLL